MAEINIKFDIGLKRRGTRRLIAALLLAGVAAEVASETLNLDTFYASPSGVYQQLWTLGNGLTVLIRDVGPTGKLLIGTTTDPGTTDRLYVSGSMFVNGVVKATTLAVAGAASQVQWNNGNSYFGAAQGGTLQLGGGTAGAPYIDFHATSGTQDFNVRLISSASQRLDVATNLNGTVLTVNGTQLGIQTTAPRAPLDVGGEGIIIARQSTCYWVNYSGACTGAQYITGVSGRAGGRTGISSTIGGAANVPMYDNGSKTGGMLCCPCPVAGCAVLP